MKITKRQLKRIIKEERAKLNEGFKEMEMEMIDSIVDMLIQNNAIGAIGDKYSRRPDYAAAVEYLKAAVIPALESMIPDSESDDFSSTPWQEPSRV